MEESKGSQERRPPVPDRETFTEPNHYGFVQTRIKNETTYVRAADPSEPIRFDEVINIAEVYGEVTEYLFLDTEFD